MASFEIFSLPLEILLIIFDDLDYKTLKNCSYVCRQWKELIENQYPIKEWENEGRKLNCHLNVFATKTAMKWKYILENLKLSKSTLLNAQINFNVDLTFDNKHFDQSIKSMQVFRDTLIVIFSDAIKFFNVEDLSLRDIKIGEYERYEVNLYMIAEKDASKQSITLYGKTKPETVRQVENKCEIPDFIYLINDERCFVFSGNSEFWEFRWDNALWKKKFLARFYSACSINFIYLMYDVKPHYDDSLWYKGTVPDNFYSPLVYTLNGAFGVKRTTRAFYKIYNFDLCEYFPLPKIIEEDIMYKFSFYLSEFKLDFNFETTRGALRHGYNIIFWSDDGKVIFKDVDLQNFNFKKRPVIGISEKQEIVAVDVYESRGTHNLLIAVERQIIQLWIKHKNLNVSKKG